MVARATAPNKIGPGSVFPDAAQWDFSDGLKGSSCSHASSLALLTACITFIRFSYGFCAILDRIDMPDCDRNWILLVLSQGTAWYVFSHLFY